MKLSISNIGWSAEEDSRVFELMQNNGFTGLEIAPTRIFPENPYDKVTEAGEWSKGLRSKYAFEVPSMQSIWYGRTEKIFGTDEEKNILMEYTKKAIDFAEIIGCGNLVFGCPKNRSMPENTDIVDAVPFFKELGDYAYEHKCVIAMEANPPIYNTNFLNTTGQALEFVKMVDSKGCMLNLDVGTMVENGESADILKGNEKYISHVHVSEPYLKPIEKRQLHVELAEILRGVNYDRYVSIEVGKQDDTDNLEMMMKYVSKIFAK